jgi:4-hydroxy-tetrahydrodipicolinate synthase
MSRWVRAFSGVTAVLVTPYADGTARVDEAVATAIARRADSAGIHVLTALGNTAEVQQLEGAERKAMLRGVAAGRTEATLLAGVAGSPGAIVDDSSYARDLGYDAVMLHEPADPFGDGRGLVDYYRNVADLAPLPVVLYLRSARVDGHSLAELVQHPNIVAAKYARQDMFTLAALVREVDSCVWVNGLAESRVPAFAAHGVLGFTSGIANVLPGLALAVHAASAEGDLSRLRELMELVGPIEAIRAEGNSRYNVSVLKEMLRWAGVETGGVRPPHSPLSESARERLRSVLDSIAASQFATA